MDEINAFALPSIFMIVKILNVFGVFFFVLLKCISFATFRAINLYKTDKTKGKTEKRKGKN